MAGMKRLPDSRRRKETVKQAKLKIAKASPIQISTRKKSPSDEWSTADCNKGDADSLAIIKMMVTAAEAARQFHPTTCKPKAVTASDKDVKKNVLFFIMLDAAYPKCVISSCFPQLLNNARQRRPNGSGTATPTR